MDYQRLLLDDFGIFQRAELHDLKSGLTVIAGPQRAGKTTFMEALRRLGYGITQGEDIPPPTDTYQLGAELSHEDAEYRLSVEGYSDPHLRALTHDDSDAPQRTTNHIFGELSKEQYRQLYTLSLNQLQRLPPTIEEPEDLSRVLLGAAYGSIADLPRIREMFNEKAHDIGRKRGHPRYGEFSDAYDQIQAAQDDLKAANEQVETYDEKRETLQKVEEQLDELQTEREELEQEQRRLTVVQQFFDDLHRYRRLGEQLDEVNPERREAFPDSGLERAEDLARKFEDACAAVEGARDDFVAESTATEPAARRDELLAVADELNEYQSEVSGWQERLSSLQEDREKLEKQRDDIETRIQQLRDDWSGEFDEIRQVETDLVSRDAVKQAVTSVTDAQDDVETLDTELDATRERKNQVEKQLASAEEDGGSRQGLLIAAGGGIVGVFAAIGLAVAISAVAGVILGALLVLVAAAIAFRQSGDGAGGGSQRTQLQAQQNNLEQEIADLKKQYDQATESLEQAQKELDAIRKRLELSDDLSPEGVQEFHNAVVDLRTEIDEFEQHETEYKEERAAVAEVLRAAAETVERVQSFEWDDEAPLDHAEALFVAVEQAAAEADLAADWKRARDDRADVQAAVIAFFEEWDSADITASELTDADPDTVEAALDDAIAEGERLAEAADYREEQKEIENKICARFRVDAVKKAFAAAYDAPEEAEVDDWYLDAFETIADQYADVQEVEDRLNAIDSRLDEIESKREELTNDRAELNQELEQLASEDDLIAARRDIQEGTRSIARLAEEYATYRIAEHITERLQDRFIEETTGPLLDEASEIFARITDEYDGIAHTGELDDLDFRVLQDSETVLGRSELSRATAEQLFMAVRLARIRQIETPLPVVLDDALTNFDPAHSARTAQLIDDLATTNQVFFLTAHPAFVELTAEYADVAQFWWLDNGRFEGPFDEPERVTAELAASPLSPNQ